MALKSTVEINYGWEPGKPLYPSLSKTVALLLLAEKMLQIQKRSLRFVHTFKSVNVDLHSANRLSENKATQEIWGLWKEFPVRWCGVCDHTNPTSLRRSLNLQSSRAGDYLARAYWPLAPFTFHKVLYLQDLLLIINNLTASFRSEYFNWDGAVIR